MWHPRLVSAVLLGGFLFSAHGTAGAEIFNIFRTKPSEPASVRAQTPEEEITPYPDSVLGEPEIVSPYGMPAHEWAPEPYVGPGTYHSQPSKFKMFVREQLFRHKVRNFKQSRALKGQSVYFPYPPLDTPNYGYFPTCWRKMPETHKCPPAVPALLEGYPGSFVGPPPADFPQFAPPAEPPTTTNEIYEEIPSDVSPN